MRALRGTEGVDQIPATAVSEAGITWDGAGVVVERYDLCLLCAAPNGEDNGVEAKAAYTLHDARQGGVGVVVIITERAAAEIPLNPQRQNPTRKTRSPRDLR